MQHGFAARDEFFASLLASKRGFLNTYEPGIVHVPNSVPDRIMSESGKGREALNVVCKPYASVASTHAATNCIIQLQDQYRDKLGDLGRISDIVFKMSAMFHRKSGWTPVTIMVQMVGCKTQNVVEYVPWRKVLTLR